MGFGAMIVGQITLGVHGRKRVNKQYGTKSNTRRTVEPSSRSRSYQLFFDPTPPRGRCTGERTGTRWSGRVIVNACGD